MAPQLEGKTQEDWRVGGMEVNMPPDSNLVNAPESAGQLGKRGEVISNKLLVGTQGVPPGCISTRSLQKGCCRSQLGPSPDPAPFPGRGQ